MANKQDEGDCEFLEELTTTRMLDHHKIEMEMESAAISLSRQKKIATVLLNKWNHHKTEDAFMLASAAEQMQLTAQCLREAEVTKERILRIGTHYLLLDFLHEYMTKSGHASASGRQSFLERSRDYSFGSEAISELVASHRTVLDFAVTEMSAMLHKQENELKEKDRLTSSQVQRIVRKELELLQTQLSSRPQIENTVDAQSPNKIPHSSPQKNVEQTPSVEPLEDSDPEETPGLPESQEEEDRHQEDDDSYFNRMVSEVADANGASESPNPTSDGDEPSPKLRVVDSDTILSSRIRRIEEKVERMKEDLKHFPFRDRRDRSEGVHPWRTCAFCDEQGNPLLRCLQPCPRWRCTV
ncbi:hypothetical protein COOONC_03780 [Cooperia oncophora]